MSSKGIKYVLIGLIFIIVQAGMLTYVSKGYCQQTISPLAATQKGLEKIVELVSSKKLEGNWAETFSNVAVSVRNIKGFAEYVLEFTSASGSPATVTLYYNFSGTYSGSSLGD